ncbi:DUF3558 family protein [Nocardia aobensis]|uniref:DUF3558 family protein n=1 Tax=Nocardia aobensis TaxID=257277 RepID=UPI000684FA22|nr:DUF3558 family protein [Nocardia aobensis]
MRRARRLVVAVALIAAATGCSSGPTPAQRPARSEDELLQGCGPETDAEIANLVHATAVHREGGPTICAWEGNYPGGGIVDITYAWFAQDSLLRDGQVAAALGYRTDHLVVADFGGLIWHDPRDPGSCGVSAADSGTVTYWVQNRSRLATPDPCAAAMNAEKATVKLDG